MRITNGCRMVGSKTTYYLDGQEVTEAEYLKLYPPKTLHGRCGTPYRPARRTANGVFKPIISEALAVHPDQVKEATEDAIKKGVPTDFLPDGRPVLRTRAHRKAYCKAYGFFDRDGGYGDAQHDGSLKPTVDPREY